MNRDIKFRVFDSERHIMIYDAQNTYNGNTYTDDNVLQPGVEKFSSFLNEDRYEVMQYIGMKDKNGKFMFEGDFIVNDNGVIGEIYYIPCKFSVSSYISDAFDNFNESGAVNLSTGNVEWVKIIGNIYENPELII